MMLKELTTFTEIAELYLRNENQNIDNMNRTCRWGNGLSIETQLHHTQQSLDNTVNALICTLELLKQQDANKTLDSKASNAV